MIFLISDNGYPIADKLAMDIVPWAFIALGAFFFSFLYGAWLIYVIPVAIVFIAAGFLAFPFTHQNHHPVFSGGIDLSDDDDIDLSEYDIEVTITYKDD